MIAGPLYLASASPRRSQLLTAAGIAFTRLLVPVDEERLAAHYDGPLERLGEHLARHKALAAIQALTAEGRTGAVLAADTTVLIDGTSLAKPQDAAEALTMLRTLRGRTHVVATGIALVAPAQWRLTSATSATAVTMRDYSDAEMAAYVATGDPLDKAGAYSLQHPAFAPVASIKGCHLGVIGLPLCLVHALISGAAPTASPECLHAATTSGALCCFSAHCTAPFPPADGFHDAPLDNGEGPHER